VLVKIIREMAKDYATDLRNSDKSINIVFSCSKELESSPILADQDRIRQVITNLVDNAIKFTEKGMITLTTEIEMKMIV
jgi:signal transduction histidine kinase